MTEYRGLDEELASSKYLSDNRCTQATVVPGTPVTCLKRRNRTIRLLLFITFAVC